MNSEEKQTLFCAMGEAWLFLSSTYKARHVNNTCNSDLMLYAMIWL